MRNGHLGVISRANHKPELQHPYAVPIQANLFQTKTFQRKLTKEDVDQMVRAVVDLPVWSIPL